MTAKLEIIRTERIEKIQQLFSLCHELGFDFIKYSDGDMNTVNRVDEMMIAWQFLTEDD